MWSTLKWPRGHNWGWQDHEDKEGEILVNVQKMSDCTAHCERKRGEILPNVQCQARAFRHCVQKLYGGRHECCALAATSKQPQEAW